MASIAVPRLVSARWAPVLKAKLEHYQSWVACFHGMMAYRSYLWYGEGFHLGEGVLGPQDHIIGRSRVFVVPNPSPANARYSVADLAELYRQLGRFVEETEKWTRYEVVLDVFEDVIAYGLITIPKGIKPDERRPVVVCQHGLEGRPQDTIGEQGARHYSAFATVLAERGFVTFAPQNLYIFKDKLEADDYGFLVEDYLNKGKKNTYIIKVE